MNAFRARPPLLLCHISSSFTPAPLSRFYTRIEKEKNPLPHRRIRSFLSRQTKWCAVPGACPAILIDFSGLQRRNDRFGKISLFYYYTARCNPHRRSTHSLELLPFLRCACNGWFGTSVGTLHNCAHALRPLMHCGVVVWCSTPRKTKLRLHL